MKHVIPGFSQISAEPFTVIHLQISKVDPVGQNNTDWLQAFQFETKRALHHDMATNNTTIIARLNGGARTP